jgi:hypothetical protein
LAEAVGNLCEQLSGSKVLQTAAAGKIRKEILAPDVQLLSAIVPELTLIVGTVKPESQIKRYVRRDGISNLQFKIVLLFRKLLFILSSNTAVIL